MHALVIVLLFVGAPDTQRAERLYERARYDEALAALGPSCVESLDLVGCEQLRGFILAALGKTEAARDAFVRLLWAEPDHQLGVEVAPKLASVFEEAREFVRQLNTLTLSPVEGREDGVGWRFSVDVSDAPGIHVERLRVFFQAPGLEGFEPVELRPQEHGWGTTIEASLDSSGVGHYYLEVALQGGNQVQLGSARRSRIVQVVDRFASDQFNALTRPWPPREAEPEVVDEPTPDWVWWTVTGLVAVAVVGGVVVGAYVLTQPSDTKMVSMGVSF